MAKQKKDIIYDSAPSDAMDDFWLEQGKKMIEGSLEAAREAAKALLTGISVVQGIYLGILGLADYIPKTMSIYEKILFLIPFILLLFSLHNALRVMMTDAYEVNIHSPDEIRELSKTTLEEKQNHLQNAFMFFAAGIIIAILLMILRIKI